VGGLTSLEAAALVFGLAATFFMTTRALSRRWDWRSAVGYAVLWLLWLGVQVVFLHYKMAIVADAAYASWWASVAWTLYPVRAEQPVKVRQLIVEVSVDT
jgi:hypothetical protein